MGWRRATLLLTLLSLAACNATPLPTPPSARPDRIVVLDEQGDRVVLRGEDGAIAGGISALRATSPTGRTEGTVTDGGAFILAVSGDPSDRFFLEALLPTDDVFVLSFVAGTSSRALEVDPGPDSDGDGSPDAIDCAPMDASASGRRCPGTCAEERCDGRDTDCDGAIDEGCSGSPCSSDIDCVIGSACSAGLCAPVACMTSSNCPAGSVCASGQCLPRGDDGDGDGYSAPLDCVDSDPAIHPGAAELCDMVDQDCDGMVDEACAGAGCIADSDCPMGTLCNAGVCGASSCMADADCPMGTVCTAGVCGAQRRDDDSDGYFPPADCNDAEPTIHPGAIELCNMVDDDCDGTLDEGCGMTGSCMADSDCPAGFLCEAGACRRMSCMTDMDCAAGEVCVSFECQQAMGPDGDMDGFLPPADCNDMEPTINPGAMEVCMNMVDDDCDGTVDEGC